MRIDNHDPGRDRVDTWLEAQCGLIQAAGRSLAQAVGQVNQRVDQARNGELGRKQRITEALLRQSEEACRTLHDVQVAVQNALFDCEHELRELRERELSPAELLIDGERLIRYYRFLRKRARVIDGLLAYLPAVTTHAVHCLQHLKQLREEAEVSAPLRVPDCAFAVAALEELREEEAVSPRRPRA